MSAAVYSLPPLPYAYDIMQLHHGKHHQAYVDNLNKALAAAAANGAGNTAVQRAIRFHGGGHINHCLFWENLAPASSPDTDPQTAPVLLAALAAAWGSLDAFKRAFADVLLALHGSGWGWLVKHGHVLRIVTTKDQDLVDPDQVPLLGIDMWEHAYYLQYLNVKAAYVEIIWHVVNWKTAEARFLRGPDDAFKVLRAFM